MRIFSLNTVHNKPWQIDYAVLSRGKSMGLDLRNSIQDCTARVLTKAASRAGALASPEGGGIPQASSEIAIESFIRLNLFVVLTAFITPYECIYESVVHYPS